jgi:hypothetical protein
VARLPELQPYDLPCAGIEFPQARVGFLGHSRAGIVVLKANPSDVHLSVVVSVDPHDHKASAAATRHNPSNESILAIRMLIRDHQTTHGYQPTCLARVAPALVVTLQQRRLNIQARVAKLLRLVERMERPAN